MPTPGPETARKGVVVLVPGLGLGGLEVIVLARRLRRLGWRVVIFRHFPWRGSLGDKASALLALCRAQGGQGGVHLAGHSMGGLIVLEALARGAPGPAGRVVLLGSPINGSDTARRVAALPLGKRLLGDCMDGARRTAFRLPDARETGGIAGRTNVGVGRLFGIGTPADGVVRVEEALRTGMADTRVVDEAHTGMLFSNGIVALVDSFLRYGRFTGPSDHA